MAIKKDKFHALLAVEGDVKATADRAIRQAEMIFTRKQDVFIGTKRTYETLIDGGTELDPEGKELTTTVTKVLDALIQPVKRSIDVAYQKELGNTKASADLIIDDEVLASDVPATALLNLETKLKALRALYGHIPTLQDGVAWAVRTDGVYENKGVKTRTEKQLDSKILYNATEHHPAQIEKISKDVPVGKWTTVVEAGLLSSAEKTRLLERIDALLIATKKARMRANDTDYEKVTIGKKIFDYILK